MKARLKLRKPVLLGLLLVTVLSPILLYTDRQLSTFIPSSSTSPNEFIEDVSTVAFGGEIRPLNVLPHESSTALKEPSWIVYLENSTHSLPNSDNTRKTRQLTEELVEDQQNTVTSTDENPIRQVTEGANEAIQGDGILQKPESLLEKESEPLKEEKLSVSDSAAQKEALFSTRSVVL